MSSGGKYFHIRNTLLTKTMDRKTCDEGVRKEENFEIIVISFLSSAYSYPLQQLRLDKCKDNTNNKLECYLTFIFTFLYIEHKVVCTGANERKQLCMSLCMFSQSFCGIV